MTRGRKADIAVEAVKVAEPVLSRSRARMRLLSAEPSPALPPPRIDTDLGHLSGGDESSQQSVLGSTKRRGRPPKKHQQLPQPPAVTGKRRRIAAEEVATATATATATASVESSSSAPTLLLTPPSSSMLSRRISHRLRESSDVTQPHFFVSCLTEDVEQPSNPNPWHSDDFPSSSSALTTTSSSSSAYLQEPSPRSLPVIVLRRALSMQVLGDECWLSSSFMDLVVTQFAKEYNNVRYFSADFSRINHHIPHEHPVRKKAAASAAASSGVTDILGRPWNASFSLNKPSSSLIFFANPNNIHWTLIRVVLHPAPELQLFEPMGMPSRQNRHTGLNFRSVPKSIIDWLDATIPLTQQKSWLTVGNSVITNKHQVTSYDCGVACLLYAEKCGQGQTKEWINDHTTQEDITQYRKLLQDFMEKINGPATITIDR